MTLLDFGNGFYADTEDMPFIKLGHSGLDMPQFEVAVTENGVSDGSTIGSTRAKGREMIVPIEHGGLWGSRREIARAFTPGIERILSSEFGSMPYYCRGVVFPDALLDTNCTLELVSEHAFPLGEPKSVSAGSEPTGGRIYPFTYPYSFESVEAADAISTMSECDVRTPVRIAITTTLAADDLVLTIGEKQTRIVGPFQIGDDIVVDATTDTPTLTVNGVNALGSFDVTTDWPAIDPGFVTIACSVISYLTVSWRPRVLGLI